MSKLKMLNKETVSFVLLNDLNLPDEVIGEIVEIIWRSDERLEEIQRANTACTRLMVGTRKLTVNPSPPPSAANANR